MAPPAPGCAHLSGTTPTPVGGDGHQHGTPRQRAATAIAPIVKELIYTIHSQGRGWQSTSAERCVCDVKSCSEGPRFGSGIAIDIRKVPGTALKNQTTGKVVYTPPEGQARLRDLLANCERFLHDDSDLDPLIRMAVGHYQFEAIHRSRTATAGPGAFSICCSWWNRGCWTSPSSISVAPSSSGGPSNIACLIT